MHDKLLIVTLLLIFFIFDSRFFNPPYSSRQNVKLNRNKKFPRNNINSCSKIAITHIDQCQTTRRLQEETEGSRYEKFSTTIFNYPPPSRYRHLSSAAKRKQRGSKEERERGREKRKRITTRERRRDPSSRN